MYLRKARQTEVSTAKMDGVVEAYVGGTGIVDQQGDEIEVGAFRRSLERRPHPIGLAAHIWEHRVARTVEAEELDPGDKRLPERIREAGGGAVRVVGQYNLAEDDVIARQEFARVVFFGPQQEWSIGAFVLQTDDAEDHRILRDIDWVEWSSVVAGAFPLTETVAVRSTRAQAEEVLRRLDALQASGVHREVVERWLALLDRRVAERLEEVERAVRAAAYGPELRALMSVLALEHQRKSAIPPHSTEVVERQWDGARAVARCPAEARSLRALHAWVDDEADPDTKQAYKLPHHEVDEEGRVGAANIRGVRAALAALAGARGGVDIPEEDVPGVRAHLERHVADWEEMQERARERLFARITVVDRLLRSANMG